MSNLFVLLDIASKGFLDVFLDIIPYFSILLGTCVINNKNPIVSVLFLIGLFLSISINLILLGYNFLGLSYLLVYVGAVSILFLFILMLINVRISELLNETNNGIPLAIFTSFSFGFPVYKILNQIDSINDKYKNLDLSSWLNYENISEDILNSYKTEDISNNDYIANLLLKNQDNFSLENTFNILESDIETTIDNDKELSEMYFATSNTWDDNFSLENTFNILESDIETTINNNKELSDVYYLKNQDNFSLENTSNILESDIETTINNDKELSEMYFATSNTWDDNIIEFSDISSIGNILYTNYAMWLIICSIILLLAMIGAISITKKEKD